MELPGGEGGDEAAVPGAARNEGLCVGEGLPWPDLAVDAHGPGPAGAADLHAEEAVRQGDVQGVAEGEGCGALLADLALGDLRGEGGGRGRGTGEREGEGGIVDSISASHRMGVCDRPCVKAAAKETTAEGPQRLADHKHT